MKLDFLFVEVLWLPKQEQKSHTYHPPLPDDAHTVLNAWKAVRDLCEIILAHGPLFDCERTVIGRQDV